MDNLTRNKVNLLHSIVASFLSYYYIYYGSQNLKRTIFFISNTYFLFDTYQIRNKDSLDIVHHILSIFSLFCFYLGHYETVLIKLFNLAELSNVAIFGHYHIIKKVQNRNVVLISSILEFLIYTYLRVFCITQIIIDNYEIVLFSPLSILLILYYMSIDWSYTLFHNLKSEILSI